ncbi:MAG: tRNA-binding protein [Armatimonadetes bacterium]|nr:tRNA-binding protein [Armatimonadota bacterium]
MSSELKPMVTIDVLESLDIRMGRVMSVEPAPDAPKKSYKLRVDFGKYGVRTSVARLTCHSVDELVGLHVFGVLNFPPRMVGSTESEFLCLGVQVAKLDSGEATPITPLNPNVKVGSKLF